MGHSHHPHDHSHDNDTYYLDQLCMIGITGAFAGICLALYFLNQSMLSLLLKPAFFPLVLATGITLLVVVVLRAAVLWQEVGKHQQIAHAHHHGESCDHHHDHDCGHDHHHHDHDHHHHDHDHGHTHEHAKHVQAASAVTGVSAQPLSSLASLPVEENNHGAHDHGGHDHDHGWAPWRYVVLLVPMMLYLLGLPSRILPFSDTGGLDVQNEAVLTARLVGLGLTPLEQGPLAAFLCMDQSDRLAAQLGTDANSLANMAPIFLDGRAATLSELKPDMKVALQLKIDPQVMGSKGVAKLEALTTDAVPTQGATLGVIKAVDVAERTVTVALDGGTTETFDLEAPEYIHFLKLESLVSDPMLKQKYRGKKVQVVGQFVPNSNTDRIFTIARFRIQCCAADAVQLNVPIVSREGIKDFSRDDWVRVTGRIEFWAGLLEGSTSAA